RFTDEFDGLPSTAPVNHAHIIDIETIGSDECNDFSGSVKIWDAVATMLFRISPETLKDFLNPEVKAFKLVQKSKHPSSDTQLVIWRKGNEVFVGQFVDLSEEYNIFDYEWDNIIRSTISDDGAWKLTYASFREYSKANLNEAWAGRLDD
ncbi:hypothetical protein BDV96DRAFT_451225, partial [Lophiotrema nucula]